MLRNSASRLLFTAAHRSWNSSSLGHSAGIFPFQSSESTFAIRNLSSLNLPFSKDRRRQSERNRYEITHVLLQNSSLTLLRYSSTTSTAARNNDQENENHPTTLRERFEARRDHVRERYEARRDQAEAAAKRGAKSAKELIKLYGPVFVGTYFVVYASTLASLFVAVESGALDPVYVLSKVSANADEAKSSVEVIVEFMNHYTWTEPYGPWVERNPEIANLAVAWIATKFTEPFRLAFTAITVPRLARYLGYTSTETVDKEKVADENAADKETRKK